MKGVKHIKAKNIIDECGNRNNNILDRLLQQYLSAKGVDDALIKTVVQQVKEQNARIDRLEQQLTTSR